MMNCHDDLILDNQRLKAQALELARIVDGLRRELAEEKRGLKAESTPGLRSAAGIAACAAPGQQIEHPCISHTSVHVSAKTSADLANAIGKDCWETPGVAFLGVSWATYRAMLDARPPFRDPEFSRVLSDDLQRYLSASGMPVFDDRSRFSGHPGTASDLRTSKRSEEAAQKAEKKAFRFLNVIVDNIPTAFQLTSVQDGFRVVTWNKAAQDLYGLTREETIGRTMHDLWPKVDADRMHAADLELVAGGVMQEFPDCIAHTKKRGAVHVHMRKLPLKDASGAVTHILLTAVDITDRLAAETRLHQSQALFHSLTHLSSDWYWEIDEQYRFTEVSAGWSDQLTGLAGDYIGKTRWELDDTSRNHAAWALHRAQLEKREAFRSFEYERVDKHGKLVVICISGHPVVDANGKFTGYRGVGTDVSVRKQGEMALRNSEARFRGVVAALAEGVVLRDANGLIVDCNASAERILGRTLDQMKGRLAVAPDWKITREDGSLMPESERPIVAAMQTGLAQSNVAVHCRKPDGSDFWALVNVQPLLDEFTSSPSGFVCTLTDITQRKRAKMEIMRLKVNLEHRVQRRTAQLEIANKDLEAFSYSVAHDLRSPLNTISGFSALLQKMLPSDSGERTRHYLARIQNAARHMGELTDGLLSLAHLSRTMLTWSTVDVSALANTVIQECTERDAARVAHVTVQPGLLARADASLLRQVLENLIANAWKFTSKKPCAEISVGQQLGADLQRVYFVKDNGAGFDMAYAGKLFGSFERLHSTEEFAGSGIGLATVKRIITRHGGKIWAASSVDEGSTFYFTLGSDHASAMPGEGYPDEDPGMERISSPGSCHLLQGETDASTDAFMVSDEQFLHAFEHAAIGMTLTAVDQRELKVNKAFCRMLGYPEAELLMRTVQDITHPDDVQEDVRQSQRAFAGEIEAYQREKRYIHKSGRIVWAYLSCYLVRDVDRRPLHFISQIQDITERKQAEQLLQVNEERFRALAALTSDWFWEQDENFRFVQIPGETTHPAGVGWSTMIGKTRWELNHLDMDDSVWAAHKAQLERHEVFRDFKTTHIDVNGQIYHWHISGMPVFDASGRFTGYRGIGRNATEPHGQSLIDGTATPDPVLNYGVD
jgi:PAS domain S-box-containing protein